jgi:hypothetical protein
MLTSQSGFSAQQVPLANFHPICWRIESCKRNWHQSPKTLRRQDESQRKGKETIIHEITYKVSRLTKFPSSRGIIPENWFNSRSLLKNFNETASKIPCIKILQRTHISIKAEWKSNWRNWHITIPLSACTEKSVFYNERKNGNFAVQQL